MDRRGFLKLIGLAAAGVALEHAIPNGRVWSFPKQIKVVQPCAALSPEMLRMGLANFDALWEGDLVVFMHPTQFQIYQGLASKYTITSRKEPSVEHTYLGKRSDRALYLERA